MSNSNFNQTKKQSNYGRDFLNKYFENILLNGDNDGSSNSSNSSNEKIKEKEDIEDYINWIYQNSDQPDPKIIFISNSYLQHILTINYFNAFLKFFKQTNLIDITTKAISNFSLDDSSAKILERVLSHIYDKINKEFVNCYHNNNNHPTNDIVYFKKIKNLIDIAASKDSILYPHIPYQYLNLLPMKIDIEIFDKIMQQYPLEILRESDTIDERKQFVDYLFDSLFSFILDKVIVDESFFVNYQQQQQQQQKDKAKIKDHIQSIVKYVLLESIHIQANNPSYKIDNIKNDDENYDIIYIN